MDIMARVHCAEEDLAAGDPRAIKRLVTEYENLYCFIHCLYDYGTNINERINELAEAQAEIEDMPYELTAEDKLDILIDIINPAHKEADNEKC